MILYRKIVATFLLFSVTFSLMFFLSKNIWAALGMGLSFIYFKSKDISRWAEDITIKS